MSFDITVPAHLAILRDGGVVVPLTLMTKVPLRRLDAVGPDGNAVPVLGRQDNGELVTAMLLEALRRAAAGSATNEVVTALRHAVMDNYPSTMPRRIATLTRALGADNVESSQELQAVIALAADLVDQFLFAVLLPADVVGRRLIVKVAVTEGVSGRFPDWAFSRAGRSMDLPLALPESAASAHFEFRSPLELRVASVTLLDDVDNELALPGPAIDAGRTVHLTGLEGLVPDNGTGVRVRVELEPVANGLVRQTAVATAFVAVLYLVSALAVRHVEFAIDANRGGSIAAAALAVPALFLSVLSRRPEHAWVARALVVPRLLNIVTSLNLYLTAVWIVVLRPGDTASLSLLWLFFGVQLTVVVIAVALLVRVSAEPPTVQVVAGYSHSGGTT